MTKVLPLLRTAPGPHSSGRYSALAGPFVARHARDAAAPELQIVAERAAAGEPRSGDGDLTERDAAGVDDMRAVPPDAGIAADVETGPIVDGDGSDRSFVEGRSFQIRR